MKDFITAALPWVLCGLAVAILCARLGRQGGSKSKKLDQSMAVGAALGLLLGVTLFSALFVCVGNMIANLLYGVVDPQIREVSR